MAEMTQQLQGQECSTEAGAIRAARAPMPAPGARQRAEPGRANADALRHAIETTVIPRLLRTQARLRQVQPAQDPGLPPPSAEEIAELVDLLLTREPPASIGFVEAMRSVGTTPESIYLDLLTPAARRLGVMWEEDECSFTEVTIGLQRLHTILHLLGPEFEGPAYIGPDVNGHIEPRRIGMRALMVQAPGEQHGLGLSMVVQFFRRDGWNVWNEPVTNSADLIDRVRRHPLSLVGISISCRERLDALASDIHSIRKHSKNRDLAIMVGGPIFNEHPQLVAMVGADATAKDGRDAVRQAARLISPLAQHR
jgi:methanogenic corrinoid protein MtbC1